MRTKKMLVIAIMFVLTAAWVMPVYPASTAGEKKVLRWAYTMPPKKALSFG